jgi:hypothetical protein
MWWGLAPSGGARNGEYRGASPSPDMLMQCQGPEQGVPRLANFARSSRGRGPSSGRTVHNRAGLMSFVVTQQNSLKNVSCAIEASYAIAAG